jgi:hypothetical protein
VARSLVSWTAKVIGDESLDRARAAQRKIRLLRRKARDNVDASAKCLHEKQMAMLRAKLREAADALEAGSLVPTWKDERRRRGAVFSSRSRSWSWSRSRSRSQEGTSDADGLEKQYIVVRVVAMTRKLS